MTEETGVAPGWRIGDNVPWVVPWTGEGEFKLKQSTAFPDRFEVTQTEAQGQGAPVMGGMHLERQRAGVERWLCHVCGQPTPRFDRWMFPTVGGTMVRVGNNEVRYANNLPPLHRACAEHAARACPHLSRSRARAVSFPEEPGEVQAEMNAPPGMAKVAQSLPGGLRPIYSYFRVFGAAFSRKVAALQGGAP
jgi:ferredoxin